MGKKDKRKKGTEKVKLKKREHRTKKNKKTLSSESGAISASDASASSNSDLNTASSEAVSTQIAEATDISAISSENVSEPAMVDEKSGAGITGNSNSAMSDSAKESVSASNMRFNSLYPVLVQVVYIICKLNPEEAASVNQLSDNIAPNDEVIIAQIVSQKGFLLTRYFNKQALLTYKSAINSWLSFFFADENGRAIVAPRTRVGTKWYNRELESLTNRLDEIQEQVLNDGTHVLDRLKLLQAAVIKLDHPNFDMGLQQNIQPDSQI